MRPEPESAGADLHLGRGTADPGVGSCARSLTDRRMCSLACSSPPSARHAPHPNLLHPFGGSGLSLLGAFDDVVDGALHIERLLRQVVVLAVQDLGKPSNGFFEGD